MNYYEILRIPTTASVLEIKNAYKKLVKRYHPDIYEGNKLFAEAKIKEINEAYETLSEKSKKEIYDAELNYKKYEPKKEDFVKTYTTDDLNIYKNIYYRNFNPRIKRKSKVVQKKKKFSLSELGKKYFFKLDEFFEKEEKENLIIMILIFFILILLVQILNLI